MTTTEKIATSERADLLDTLNSRRQFLRRAVANLTDEQAAARPTVSALSLGGLIKHVTVTEARWMTFAVGGAEAMQREPIDWVGQFTMAPGETLTGLLDAYAEVAAPTAELVATLDLDASFELPKAPWYEPGARWSVRKVLHHIATETAHHAGHADIIRETIDGQKTMG